MPDSNSEELAPDDRDPTDVALERIGYPEQLRGQAIAAAAETGILERLAERSMTASDLAADRDVDADYTARLLRALAVTDVVEAADDGTYSLTPVGERFLADHPESVRDFLLFFYHPTRYAAVRHLPDVVAAGDPTGYELEFGDGLFAQCERDPEFARYFNGFQDLSNKLGVTDTLLDALDAVDFTQFDTICDVGGGYGDLLCHVLDANPHLEGMVLELPSVVEAEDRHWAPKVGVEDRCTYVAGDMFESVPEADAYVLKAILHDWPDDDCVEVLDAVHDAAPRDAHLYVRERLLDEDDPLPATVDMDLWMMLETGGRERTRAEYESLFARAGWAIDDVLHVEDDVTIMDCVKR